MLNWQGDRGTSYRGTVDTYEFLTEEEGDGRKSPPPLYRSLRSQH